MKKNSFLIGWIVLIVGLLCSVRGGAGDVNSAEGLRNALGNATVDGNVVTLPLLPFPMLLNWRK